MTRAWWKRNRHLVYGLAGTAALILAGTANWPKH